MGSRDWFTVIGDQSSVYTFAEINAFSPVPEPTTLLLMGSGLVRRACGDSGAVGRREMRRRISLFFDDGGRERARSVNAKHTPVPEPSTLLLLGSGLAGLAVRALRRARWECTCSWSRALALSMLLSYAVLFTVTPQASALTITGNFIPPGQPTGISGTGFPSIAGNAHPDVIGGGNLVDIFNATADMWERAILDDHQLTLNFAWGDLTGPVSGASAVFGKTAEGGTPSRITEGTIIFDNERGNYYLDPNPNDHTEYLLFNQVRGALGLSDVTSEIDLGAGPINAARVFGEGPGSRNPDKYTDMFSLALHEVGHGLGISSRYTNWDAETVDGDIDITSPLPFAGSTIPIFSSDQTHLSVTAPGFGQLPTVMSFGGAPRPTFRKVLTDIDILAVAQVSQFTDLNFNVLQPIPEPGTLVLVGTGLVGLARLERRKRRGQKEGE